MSFQHYLITRWNLGNCDLDWLENRRVVFEKYCLPSVESQTNKNFTWFLLSDIRTPDKFKQILDRYPAKIIYVDFKSNLCGVEDKMEKALELENIKIELPVPETDYVITSRLDNDDVIRMDYIDLIQKKAKQNWKGNNFWINYNVGYKLYKGNIFIVESKSNPFVSFVEKTESPLLTVHQVPHGKTQTTPYRSILVEEDPIWLQVVHGSNIMNKVTRNTVLTIGNSEDTIRGKFKYDLL
jgi:hypothetical protein